MHQRLLDGAEESLNTRPHEDRLSRTSRYTRRITSPQASSTRSGFRMAGGVTIQMTTAMDARRAT